MNNVFVSFILKKNPKRSRGAWTEAYDSLRGNPTQVSAFLDNEEVSGTFVTGFELYGKRIADFLEVLRCTPQTALGKHAKEELDLKKALTGQIARRVLLPLLGHSYQNLHGRDALFELLVSTIRLADRSCFDLLAARLGEIPHVLAKVISEKRSSEVLRDCTSSLVTNPKSMQDWTETAVNLAGRCESGHGVSQETEKWGLLQELKTHLYQAKDLLEARRPGSVSLPSGALPLLGVFGMCAPNSERSLLNAIEQAEKTETLSIMEAVMNTFPCRLCFLRGYEEISDIPALMIQSGTEQRSENLDLDSFEGLLGSDLGVWKVSLSAQAMKDLKHSKREGTG